MPPFNAHKNSQGFTLIETLIIVMIIGILSAISASSYLAFNSKRKVNDAVAKVQGALQECLRESMRRSKSYDVTLNTTTKTVRGDCLVTGDRALPNEVVIATNIRGTPPTINFSYRGTITLPDAGTVVFSNADTSSEKKCLVISSPLAIMRTGKYEISATNPTTIDPDNCRINSNEKLD